MVISGFKTPLACRRHPSFPHHTIGAHDDNDAKLWEFLGRSPGRLGVAPYLSSIDPSVYESRSAIKADYRPARGSFFKKGSPANSSENSRVLKPFLPVVVSPQLFGAHRPHGNDITGTF